MPPLFFLMLAAGAVSIGLTHLLVPARLQVPMMEKLTGAEYAHEQLGAFANQPWLIGLHAAIGTTFALIAPFQFWPAFRARHRRLHHILGYTAMSCLVVLAFSGVAVSIVYPFAGPMGVLPNLFWLVTIIFCLGAALAAILRRRVWEHELWITRATAITLGITLSRLYFPILVNLLHIPSRNALAIVFWIGAAGALLVAELWLSHRRFTRLPLPAAAR
jgi:hypothetical protein